MKLIVDFDNNFPILDVMSADRVNWFTAKLLNSFTLNYRNLISTGTLFIESPIFLVISTSPTNQAA